MTPESTAKIAATYFNTLRAAGIPESVATSLTSTYVMNVLFNQTNKPKEPWEG